MARGDNQKRNRGPKKSGDDSKHRSRKSSGPQEPANNIDQTVYHHAGPAQINERHFNILVDSVPYMVKAVPFSFNGETRFRVSFNGSPEHVFTWDSSLGQLRAIDDDSSTLPDNLEIAISEKLQAKT